MRDPSLLKFTSFTSKINSKELKWQKNYFWAEWVKKIKIKIIAWERRGEQRGW